MVIWPVYRHVVLFLAFLVSPLLPPNGPVARHTIFLSHPMSLTSPPWMGAPRRLVTDVPSRDRQPTSHNLRPLRRPHHRLFTNAIAVAELFVYHLIDPLADGNRTSSPISSPTTSQAEP